MGRAPHLAALVLSFVLALVLALVPALVLALVPMVLVPLVQRVGHGSGSDARGRTWTQARQTQR